jgi:hypothetical protein
MREKTSRRSIVFWVTACIVTLLVVGSVSGWWIPKLKNPSGTYVGSIPGLKMKPEDPDRGHVYYTLVFCTDRFAATRRMTMIMYWNTYQMYSSKAESRSPYTGEVIKIGKNTWKYRMLGYLRGPHDPEDTWMANDVIRIIDDSGTITFSDDYQELTMEYNQEWFKPEQDVDPRDGFPDDGELGSIWPGILEAKRISVTE